MKLIKTLALLFMTGLIVVSCQKEYSEENGSGGNATGTLKAAGTGECLPSNVQGIFLAGTALTATNFIDVTVDFTTIGSYLISTDLKNGYTFSAVGLVTTTGIQTVRLKGSGTPTTAGANTFTVTFGTSQCNIVVDVLPAGTVAASLTLEGAPGNCSGASVAGVYKAGTATDASNAVTISVNATAIGTYNITVPASNGIIFTGAGAITATGVRTITLAANGTPTAAGTNNSTVTVGTSVCTFSVTTVAAGGGGGTTAAAFTLTGAPGQCTDATPAGTYQAQVAMTAANKVTLKVNVTQAGTYAISTATANGVSFAGAGTFTATGDQTVVLTATGLPAAAGPFPFATTGIAGNSCPFTITFTAAPPPADFTLGDCSAAVPAGTYAVNTAMGTSNTVTISANVVTAGVYSATTNTVNGMSFSANAVFSGTGAQTITLTGTGTPIAEGDFDFDVTAGGSTCTFTVRVVAAPPAGGFGWSFKAAGITYSGTLETAEITSLMGITFLSVSGGTTTGFGTINLTFTSPSGGITAPTTYSGSVATGKIFSFIFSDGGVIGYTGQPMSGSNLPGILDVYNTTTKIMQGRFSGTVKDLGGALVNITEGQFKANLP